MFDNKYKKLLTVFFAFLFSFIVIIPTSSVTLANEVGTPSSSSVTGRGTVMFEEVINKSDNDQSGNDSSPEDQDSDAGSIGGEQISNGGGVSHKPGNSGGSSGRYPYSGDTNASTKLKGNLAQMGEKAVNIFLIIFGLCLVIICTKYIYDQKKYASEQ